MTANFDAIIIGAGHNGLVTACYLARAGWKVLVLERRYVVGGACVTEEVFPGYKVSTAAYVNSLFRKEIIRDLRDLWSLFKLGRSFRKMGTDAGEAVEILTGSARVILDRWFESDQLKATLATDAIIGAMAAPSMPGTAYVLFHHVMGETNGKRGVWAYVKGGMGGLTQALARVARGFGVEVRTEADVSRILVQK